MRIQHATPAIGSEIHDIDLSDARVLAKEGPRLRQLLAERQVLFFRDQELGTDAQVELARLFGRVEPLRSTFPRHPDNACVELLVSKGTRTGTDIWHADLTWQAVPPAGACLYAVDVPEAGGDTLWASMVQACDALTPAVRASLKDLKAVHSWEAPALVQSLKARDADGTAYHAMRREHPPIEQPVLLMHPVTGRELVFVNSLYTTHISGLAHEESTRLISYLSSLARVPEWQVRFHWRKGSVAIWDNLATQHYAVNDYHPWPRRMHRVAIGQEAHRGIP